MKSRNDALETLDPKKMQFKPTDFTSEGMDSGSLLLRLNQEIERVWEESLLCKRARNRTLQQAQMLNYLNELKFVFERASLNLTLAAASAERLGDIPLRDYFLEKIQEELGHEEWALSDLKNAKAVITLLPTEVTKNFMMCATGYARSNPFSYLGHILFLELFTSKITPRALPLITQATGMTGDQLLAITAHAEADHAHEKENESFLNQITSSYSLFHINAAIVETGQLVQGLLDQFSPMEGEAG